MQLAVVEFAGNVANKKNANSTEFDEQTKYPIIALIEEWQNLDGQQMTGNTKQLGGTLRLGAQTCKVLEKSLLHKSYNDLSIKERHRHRYEVNSSLILCIPRKWISQEPAWNEGRFARDLVASLEPALSRPAASSGPFGAS